MSQTPIYTIGYGSREIDELIGVLQANDIAFLIDVRSAPYSRHKPAFSKKPLREHLQTAGIRYVFMGDLLGGRPDAPVYDNNGQLNFEFLAEQPFYQQGIGRLQDAHHQGHHVALLCSEAKPENCHRSQIIGRSLTAVNIPTLHINENDQLIPQADILTLTPTPPPAPPPHTPAPPPDASTPSPLPPATLLKQIFGFDDFRPMQADIIDNVLNGQDSLVVMPTGSGKSLCYQLPALILPGLTVVVSPLISLMEDQVMQLREMGVAATFLNSTLDLETYHWTMEQIRSGQVRLLYAAPETLLRPNVLALLEQCRVDCLTIDESHCISEWGHDFRPEYRQLTEVRRRLADAVCLAVTATATERVRQDIVANLAMSDPVEFVASFDRDNLFLTVEPKMDGMAQTLAFLDAHRGESGIIYCTTRRQVDELTEHLQAHGWSALPYHAGLDNHSRRRHQHQFIRDDVPIIVATIAFGMGINKSNVRFILHYDLPKDLESYYQQIGRAGRDGLRADCRLLYTYGDVSTINFFIQQQDDQQQLAARMRLEAMLGFAETGDCRRQPLLTYFGESYEVENCSFCDNCTQEGEAQSDLTIPAQKFLSCVKRTGELFGTTHIIDVLRGSRAKKVLARRHDQLSTYNIGGEFSKKEWQFLARQFIQLGLINQDMTHGSLRLTPAGYAVLQGESVQGVLPDRPRQVTVLGDAHDRDLFNLLRAHRKELADAANVPPYAVFSDRSLVDMATYFPQSTAAFSQIYGVGQAKLSRYADEFLPIIQAYCAENDLAEKPKVQSAARPTTRRTSRMQEVTELFNEGQSVEEIAATFNVKQGTVIGHLWKAFLAGQSLRLDNLQSLSQLDPDMQNEVLDAFARLGIDYLRPVYEAFNAAVDYEELHLLRLHYAIQSTAVHG